MGCTKTICQCRGASVSFHDEEEVRAHHNQLRANIIEYLELIDVVFDARSLPDDPYFCAVAQAFVSLVKRELASLDDDTDRVRRIRASELIMSEFCRCFSTAVSARIVRNDMFSPLEIHNLMPRLSLTDLQEFNRRCELIEYEDPHRIGELAELISVCAIKVHSQYVGALPNCTQTLLKHNASMLGDLFDEMVDIFRALYPCQVRLEPDDGARSEPSLLVFVA